MVKRAWPMAIENWQKLVEPLAAAEKVAIRVIIRKQKGSTRKRALTGAEASERQQKALTRAQTRARAVQVAQDSQEKKVVTSSRRKTRSQKAAELIEDQLQRDAAEHM